MKECGFHFDTTYTSLPGKFFTKIQPENVEKPEIVILNNDLASSIGLDLGILDSISQAELFSGNKLPEKATSFCQAYSGHQFGHFTTLGDGRAYLWGEHITPNGDRFDIQFKGSGRTPYSRRGDGKAALGPMLREYIVSEAMHHLGIPTTRSLAVVTTGEPVMREAILPGAILTRVASSHIRVGTFEFAADQTDKQSVKALMNYAIKRHYPHLVDGSNNALGLLKAVIESQANLIVDWMRVGFIHGVMNTDNMAISGETIDYGPCAFMDAYNPQTVFSSIDQMGRYAYGNQPKIAQWNIARFAETLLPFINSNIQTAINLAEEVINEFPKIYHHKWLKMMCSKLGLSDLKSGDEGLITYLLEWMQKNHADYTNTFRDLNKATKPEGQVYKNKGFDEWYARWQNRVGANSESLESSLKLMRGVNPAIIPRNHKVEQALEAAVNGDLKLCIKLLEALKYPYEDSDFLKPYQCMPQPHERVYQTFCGT